VRGPHSLDDWRRHGCQLPFPKETLCAEPQGESRSQSLSKIKNSSSLIHQFRRHNITRRPFNEVLNSLGQRFGLARCAF
jgi:hypothetical protein